MTTDTNAYHCTRCRGDHFRGEPEYERHGLYARRVLPPPYDPGRPRVTAPQATAADDGPSFGVLFALFLFVALIAAAAGSFIGEARYATSCSIGPDAPGKAYTRPVLRCELPWWWQMPAAEQ